MALKKITLLPNIEIISRFKLIKILNKQILFKEKNVFKEKKYI